MNKDLMTTITGIVSGVAALAAAFGHTIDPAAQKEVIEISAAVFAAAITIHGYLTNKS